MYLCIIYVYQFCMTQIITHLLPVAGGSSGCCEVLFDSDFRLSSVVVKSDYRTVSQP